jgi:hypothetical protein
MPTVPQLPSAATKLWGPAASATSLARAPPATVAGSDAGREARKCVQLSVFVLHAEGESTHVALVDVLPEAYGDLLGALDVGGTRRSHDGVVQVVRATNLVLIQTAVVDEERISVAPWGAPDKPGVGVDLLLSRVGVDVDAGPGVGDEARQDLRGREPVQSGGHDLHLLLSFPVIDAL